MKERPILMSGPMVRATLDGRKTQTRRVVKPQPNPGLIVDGWDWIVYPGHDGRVRAAQCTAQILTCPHGQIGDHLWVRETLHHGSFSKLPLTPGVSRDLEDYDAWYATQTDIDDAVYHVTPSIHMPRWASRLTLEITDIRVEMLSDITEEDAMREGLIPHGTGYAQGWQIGEGGCIYSTAVRAFSALWDTLNAGRGFGWETNCWVWVISFQKIEATA